MNKVNMKLMWGKNLFFRKSGAKAGQKRGKPVFTKRIYLPKQLETNPQNPYV